MHIFDMGKLSRLWGMGIIGILWGFSAQLFAQNTFSYPRKYVYPKTFASIAKILPVLEQLKQQLDQQIIAEDKASCPEQFQCFPEIVFTNTYDHPGMNYFLKNIDFSQTPLQLVMSDAEVNMQLLGFYHWLKKMVRALNAQTITKSEVRAQLIEKLSVDRMGYFLITDTWILPEKEAIQTWLRGILGESTDTISEEYRSLSIGHLWKTIQEQSSEQLKDVQRQALESSPFMWDNNVYDFLLKKKSVSDLWGAQKTCARLERTEEHAGKIRHTVEIPLITSTFMHAQTRKYIAALMEKAWNGPLSDTEELKLHVNIAYVSKEDYSTSEAIGIQVGNSWAHYRVDTDKPMSSSCGEIILSQVETAEVPGHELGHAFFLNHPFMSYLSIAEQSENRLYFGDGFDIMMGGLYPSAAQRRFLLGKVLQQ